MSESPLPIRLAQTVGITSSAFLAGSVASISFALVPRLLESPTPLMLKQWSNTYNAGKKNAPPFAALSSVCYFYLAYILPSNAASSKLYAYLAAGAITVGIVPYTLLFMTGTNQKLLAKADETKALSIKDEIVEAGLGNETAHKLVDHWAVLNLGRAVMLTVASILGAWTALN